MSARTRVSPSPGVDQIALPFALFSILLLAILMAAGTWWMPVKTLQLQQTWVSLHQSIRNFVIAEKMVAPLLPAPVAHWSGALQCEEVGRGIWSARGLVKVSVAPGRAPLLAWRAVFDPATAQPLYLRVGTDEQGDLAAALRLAGAPPETP